MSINVEYFLIFDGKDLFILYFRIVKNSFRGMKVKILEHQRTQEGRYLILLIHLHLAFNQNNISVFNCEIKGTR